MDEELELFKDMKEEKESEAPIIINGDVFLTINGDEKKIDLKKIRNKITKPLKNKIKERDGKRCLCCGKKFENHLEVHHIMPVSEFPQLAHEPDNMASLCQKCHSKYHEMYKNQGAISFALFLKQYGR